MRSLKVIVFRDTDKPYTIILSSTLIVTVLFASVTLISLLTFSVLGNIMQVTNAENNEQPVESAIGTPAQGEETGQAEPEDEGLASGASEPVEDPGDSQEETSGAAGEDDAEDLPDYEPYVPILEDYAAPGGPFITVIQGGPTVASGIVRYIIRVEKSEGQLGIDGSGRFVAALVRSDGQLGPVFPSAIRSDGLEIINPRNGELFRIRYRRDISVEFAAADLEDYTAIALFIFEANGNNQLLWRKIETIRR